MQKHIENAKVTSKVLALVAYRVAKVLAFAGIGGWLIYRNTDKVTIGVGVALALVALVELVTVAYRAEAHKSQK